MIRTSAARWLPGLLLAAWGWGGCSDEASQQGAFCERTEDCMLGLVCERNTCILRVPGECSPACNPDVEACFEGACQAVIDANDRDGDFSPAAEDCDDFDRTLRPLAHEVCDGADNDCDGQTDEGCPACQEGDSRRCGTDVGECSAGTVQCSAGRWGACSGQGPEPERCDGLDNDCDGLADEVCPCHPEDELPCGVDEGRCRAGVQRCVEGRFGECVNGVVPEAEERCNGLDDDCDGETDEGFNLGTPCLEPGECGPGEIECADEWSMRCSTAPGASADGAGPERCNGLDDDCDGQTDEEFPELGTACDGPDSDRCQNGVWACDAEGQGLVCGAERVTDLSEACNSLDDDCDGLVDEDFGVGEACVGLGGCAGGAGRVECAGERNVRCSTNPGGSDFVPRAEVCDGVDNDCDGEADEDFGCPGEGSPRVGEACTGQGHCGVVPGVCECLGQQAALCSTMPGGSDDRSWTESCDDRDNDCDGLTDEDFADLGDPCETSGDNCPGRKVCSVSGVGTECYDPPSPQETCNGLDDNCDGLVDNIDRDSDGVTPCNPIPAWDCCDDPGCPDASSINPSGDWHSQSYTCGGRTSFDWNCDGWEQPRWGVLVYCIDPGWALGYGGPIPCGTVGAFIEWGAFCWPIRYDRTQECK